MTRRIRRPAVVIVGMVALMTVGLFALARANQISTPVPDSVAFEPDVVYHTVDGVPLKLDVARPKAGAGPWPLVVCIHGGGWQAGSRADFRSLIFGLAQQGFVAASVQYRLAPKHPYPAQVEDVKEAVTFLRTRAADWHVDPDRVAAVGGSAGGHLALLLATDPAVKLRAAVALAGPTDLTREFPEATDRIVRDLVGPEAKDPAAVRRAASPIHRVGPESAPVFLIHGDRDEIVPYDQSTTFRDAYAKAGREVVLITIPNGDHAGQGGKPDALPAAVIQAVRFLQDHTRADPSATR